MSVTAKKSMMGTGTPANPNGGIGVYSFAEELQQSVKLVLVPNILESETSVDYEHARQDGGTTCGFTTNINELSFTTADAIFEIRFRSGLTWELLGDLFNVSRRSIHHWANGMVPSAQHERDIWQVLKAIRHLDEGDNSATRTRLLATNEGTSVFDLLSSRRFEEVLSQAAGAGPSVPKINRIHSDEIEKRRPPSPIQLLGAIQERPEIPAKNVRAVSVAELKKKAP